jgi:hypothetical protein
MPRREVAPAADDLNSDAPRYVPDREAVAGVTGRLRAPLAEPETADLRDPALVTPLVRTQSLGPLLNGRRGRSAQRKSSRSIGRSGAMTA